MRVRPQRQTRLSTWLILGLTLGLMPSFQVFPAAAKTCDLDVSALESVAVAKRPPNYAVEADVSMRTIAVNATFSGARVIIFGAVVAPDLPATDREPFDVVAVIQGPPSSVTVRHKTQIAGLWLNTSSVAFEDVPVFYAVASTRPLNFIADDSTLAASQIGLEHTPLSSALADAAGLKPGVTKAFLSEAVRLGMKEKRYFVDSSGIGFVGKSLFRGAVDLPASVPVASLQVTVYLFHQGCLVARNESYVDLSREGFEKTVFEFAHEHGLLYGMATVAAAVTLGLFTSLVLRRLIR